MAESARFARPHSPGSSSPLRPRSSRGRLRAPPAPWHAFLIPIQGERGTRGTLVRTSQVKRKEALTSDFQRSGIPRRAAIVGCIYWVTSCVQRVLPPSQGRWADHNGALSGLSLPRLERRWARRSVKGLSASHSGMVLRSSPRGPAFVHSAASPSARPAQRWNHEPAGQGGEPNNRTPQACPV
jgi:hypothetical protein